MLFEGENMGKIEFDINDGDFVLGDDNIGFDSNGHMMMSMGDNMSMDMETGEMHFTSSFNNDSNMFDFNDDQD